MIKLLTIFSLIFLVSQDALAATLKADLYRAGNASTPRMDNVRERDVTIFEKQGTKWVKAKKNGVSTTSIPPKDPKNWWKISSGTKISDDIYVVNDYANHWSWAPARDMPLSEFVMLMKTTNANFVKLK